MGISVVLFTGSGPMDLSIANDIEPNFLFVNQGDGTFKESGLEYGVAYNEDGNSALGTALCGSCQFGHISHLVPFVGETAHKYTAIKLDGTSRETGCVGIEGTML